MTIGVGLLSWVFLIAPNIHLSGLSWLAKSVSIAYPLGDVLLLAAAIRLAVDAGKRAPAFYLLAGSIVCLLATDSAYNLALLNGTYNHQLDLRRRLDPLLPALGRGRTAPLDARARGAGAPDLRTRLTPAAAHAARRRLPDRAPEFGSAQELGNPDVLVLIIASAFLFLLVVARMAGLVRQEGRGGLARARPAGALASISSPRPATIRSARPQSPACAVCSATISLVRLALVGERRTPRWSRRPTAAGWQLDDSTADWLSQTAGRRHFTLRTTPCRPSSGPSLRLFAGDTVLVVPLSIRSEVRPMLVVCSPTSVQPALVDSLEALGTQISLALDGASLAADLHRRQSEARFRSLVAHSSDLITVLDTDGVVTYQSPSIERVLGYSVDDVEGSRFDRILSETDRPRLRQLIAGNGSSGPDGHTFECSLEHLDGTQPEVRGPAHRSPSRRARPGHRPQQP